MRLSCTTVCLCVCVVRSGSARCRVRDVHIFIDSIIYKFYAYTHNTHTRAPSHTHTHWQSVWSLRWFGSVCCPFDNFYWDSLNTSCLPSLPLPFSLLSLFLSLSREQLCLAWRPLTSSVIRKSQRDISPNHISWKHSGNSPKNQAKLSFKSYFRKFKRSHKAMRRLIKGTWLEG